MVDLVPACLPRMLQQKTLPYGTPFEVGTLCTAYKHLLSDETPRAASVQIHTAAACCSTDSLPRTVLDVPWFSGCGTKNLSERRFDYWSSTRSVL
jgi:hypothetical protein